MDNPALAHACLPDVLVVLGYKQDRSVLDENPTPVAVSAVPVLVEHQLRAFQSTR